IATCYLSRNRPCGLYNLRDIFGSLLDALDGAKSPDELLRRLLLDTAIRAALRSGAATRARVPAQRARRTRRYPQGVAGLAARPACGREARDDLQPGDRSMPHAPAVRTRPGLLRRAVRATALRPGSGESRRRGARAGQGVRGDGRVGRVVRCAGADRRGDSIADWGLRIAHWKCGRRIRNL